MSDLRPRGARGVSTIARHGRLKRSHPLAVIAKFIAAGLAVVLVSGTSVAAFAAWDLQRGMKPSIHLVGESPKPAAPLGPIAQIGPLQGSANILITATDTRTGQGGSWGTTLDSAGAGLNDATMLLHISADHKSATVVAFPRDLMIPIPQCPNGHGGWNSAMSKRPLNTTLSDGGVACTVLTIQSLIGQKGFTIPYAGVVEFNGVVAMSNAVGGVPVCVANGIHDYRTGLALTAGVHNLKGHEAAEFLRARHGLGDGSDIGRISNQQVFFSALVRTMRQDSTLSNPAKVWGLAKAVSSNVYLSDSLNNLTTLYQLALAVKNIQLSNVLFVQYPVLTDPDDVDKVIPDSYAANILFSALAADKPMTLGGTTGRGAVIGTPPPSAPGSTPTNPPTPGSTTPPTTAPTDASAPAVVLPSNISGQTASTYTCSKGQG